MKDMHSNQFVVFFEAIDKTKFQLVGGKGANLGELSRVDGINIPAGFIITTEAFKKVVESNLSLNRLIDELSCIDVLSISAVANTCSNIRSIIENIFIPDSITDEISAALSKFNANGAFAVRSSATAEDLFMASFAGQQDSYLNITGRNEILKHVSKCWASLFNERAVIYRIQNGFDHRKIQMAVVVQTMIMSYTSGIMFTADPVSSNRKVISIDASFGLGEALVSGIVNPDQFKVREGNITVKNIQVKKRGVFSIDAGGTRERNIEEDKQNRPSLSDQQVLSLEQIGRKIEEHFGHPQDIEWCLADDIFYIVQSRPITTLFPVPEYNDGSNHVYVSVGHQQMMTDAMKPLGLSFYLLLTGAPMSTAGGRLFVDVAPMLATADGRRTMINVLGKSDPLIRDALTTIVKREGFIKMAPETGGKPSAGKTDKANLPDYETLSDYDPGVVTDLIRRDQAAIEKAKVEIKSKTGVHLFDFILSDIQQLKKSRSDSESFGVIMTGMNASTWVNEKMNEWLGEKGVADTLAQSAPNNVTSEMGLALLDVADVIRSYPDVITFLKGVKSDNFLNELLKLDGGKESRDAINTFLNLYGMRCVGEIDITRARWSEKPDTLIPMILANIKNFTPGARKRKFEQGLQKSREKENELLSRLRQLPGGEQKVQDTKRMIGLIRNFIGYREYPKYAIVSRLFIYKQAILKEIEQLVEAAVIQEKEDIFYLTFGELREVVQANKADYAIINKRKEEYNWFKKLTPPRVITSDGEIVAGNYKHESVPTGASVGLAVSAGVVEGRARVILRIEDAELEDGDILVTSFTDPSWTPLFVSIKGLVTEVGGLMTHGAVIAREYGLPAVIGVENATKVIKDGQRIRVNGTDGYVEIL